MNNSRYCFSDFLGRRHLKAVTSPVYVGVKNRFTPDMKNKLDH